MNGGRLAKTIEFGRASLMAKNLVVDIAVRFVGQATLLVGDFVKVSVLLKVQRASGHVLGVCGGVNEIAIGLVFKVLMCPKYAWILSCGISTPQNRKTMNPRSHLG